MGHWLPAQMETVNVDYTKSVGHAEEAENNDTAPNPDIKPKVDNCADKEEARNVIPIGKSAQLRGKLENADADSGRERTLPEDTPPEDASTDDTTLDATPAKDAQKKYFQRKMFQQQTLQVRSLSQTIPK
ncbi:hypothetical protein MMC27_008343 [Xylographa pallens]|nr:hypothetical protein [Xylographa pallens]